MRLRLGLSAGERLSKQQTIDFACYCDEAGFDSIWVAEGRLTRDAIVPAAVIASHTRRIRIGTGVINHRTRNAALTAVTFKTLDEFAPGRIILGIGPWWEPLASKLGLPLKRPLQELPEYIEVIRRLFRAETVDFEGSYVTMRGARFDFMYQENREVPVPIYLGAVGPRMLELAGRITDGVLLDFLLPPSYTTWALERIEAGIAERTDGVAAIDRPQLVACSVDDDDPQSAIDACKAFFTMYLAQQPHIGQHVGIDPELLEQIRSEFTWPATPEQVRHTMRLVPDELVHRVAACGRTVEAVEQIERFLAAGATCAVLCTLGDDKESTLRSIATALAD